MFERLSRTGKNYRRLTLTYLIVMVFPLFIGILLTFMMNHETEKAIIANYEDRLSYSADTADQILRYAGSCAYGIVTDRNVISYSALDDPLKDAVAEYMKKPIQTSIIAEMNANEKNISDIIISFPRTEVMLSTQRTYRNEDRDLLCRNTLGLSYEEVLQLAGGVKGRQYFISSGRDKTGNPVPFLIQKGLGKNAKSLYVIIVLKSGSLTDALAYSSGNAIIGTDPSCYIGSGDVRYDPSFLDFLFSDEAISRSHAVSRYGYVTFARQSPVTGWNYMLVLDKSDYQGRVSGYRYILILVFTVTVLFGIILIVRISRIVYSPVQKLIGDAGEEYRPKEVDDEFDFLSGVFRQLRENYIPDAAGNDPEGNSLLSLTLNRILCQGSRPSEQLAEKLRLQSEAYLISVLDIEFLSEKLIANDDSGGGHLFFRSFDENAGDASSDRPLFYFSRMSENDKKQVNFTTYRIVSELLNADNSLITLITFVEGNIVIILPLSEEPEVREQQTAEFDRKMRLCCDILSSRVGIAVSPVIGDPTEKKEQLYDRYNSLKLYLKKKHFLGTGENRVIYLCREQQTEPKYDRSYEIEKTIGSKIVEKEYDVAYEMLEYFFNYILENKADYSLQLLQLRMYGMIYVLISSLELNTEYRTSGSGNNGAEAVNALSPELLLTSENVLELRNNAQLLFRELLRSHHEETKGTVLARSDEICDYVNRHAFSPDLCAAAICDEFHISVSYLSRIFKQATGTNLLKYIHGIRIGRAKELLAGTDISINDIASLVGFSDRRSFDRVFTGAEGMTPYNYRVNIHSAKGETMNESSKGESAGNESAGNGSTVNEGSEKEDSENESPEKKISENESPEKKISENESPEKKISENESPAEP